MGQTLTHGIYLPDEGERNCYNGLAGNWQLLDGAVGTVAEHTSQIAGKASASHTHGNITNDGKLATASKALVTDSNKNITTSSVSDTELSYLSGVTSAIQTQLNSKAADSDVVHKAGNETISGDKAFTQIIRNKSEVLEIGRIPSSNTDIGYRVVDKNNTITANLQYTQYTSGNSQFALNLRTKDNNNNIVNKSVLLNTDQYGTWFNFRPSENSSISLGSTSYRWSAVCSDSYYYGTTAWGLDKANTWTNFQRMTSNPAVWYLRNNTVTLGTAPASNRYIGMFFEDVNGADLGFATFQANKNSYNSIIFNLKNYDGTNTYVGGLRFSASTTGAYSFFPEDSECDLGTSTNKWKTLNGINPGALSLPNSPGGTGTENINYYDLSGNITVRDGSTFNRITASCDGWIAIGTFATWLQISNDTLILATTANPGADGFAQAFLPVRKGNSIRIVVNQTNTQFQSFKLLPCEGNV